MTPHVSWRGPRLAGLALLALGIVALAGTAAIPSARDGWSISGPRFLPLVVAIALVALSLAVLARTFVWRDVDLAEHVADEAQKTEWPAPALVLASLAGYVLVLAPLGYALATALFFTASARILGSERRVRDAISGVVVGVVTSYAFTRWLGVRLPVGPWGV